MSLQFCLRKKSLYRRWLVLPWTHSWARMENGCIGLHHNDYVVTYMLSCIEKRETVPSLWLCAGVQRLCTGWEIPQRGVFALSCSTAHQTHWISPSRDSYTLLMKQNKRQCLFFQYQWGSSVVSLPTLAELACGFRNLRSHIQFQITWLCSCNTQSWAAMRVYSRQPDCKFSMRYTPTHTPLPSSPQRVSRMDHAPSHWYDYGVFCLLVGDTDRSRQCFKEAISLDQRMVPA